MTVNSQEATARENWDTAQLLNIVNQPPGPERTLGAFTDFTSSKNYVETACMLNGEDAAKLVDMFDQVRHAGLRNSTLTRLTTAVMTRLSDPSIEGRLEIRRC